MLWDDCYLCFLHAVFGQMSPTLVGSMSPVQPCRSSPAGGFKFGASLPRSAMSVSVGVTACV